MIIFSSISYYSTASTSEAAYIIGGDYTKNIIAEFKNGSWRQMGTLADRIIVSKLFFLWKRIISGRHAGRPTTTIARKS